MDDKKKLTNWVAGISTVIVSLLIIIVCLESRQSGISLAMASKTIALTIADKNTVRENGPEESFFPEELKEEWYVKYMDYLYETGLLDPESCPATEKQALSAVTYGELGDFLGAYFSDDSEAVALAEYRKRGSGKHAGEAVSSDDFWKFFDLFQNAADSDERLAVLETDLYGTPGNVPASPAWTAYTKDGKYTFEGLSLDTYIDKKVKLLVSGSEIIKVEKVISDEIVYENAWISGFADGTVTIFIGNIQRDFPVQGVLKDESELSGQIGDLYLKSGKPKRLVLKKERITGTVLAVRDHEIELEGYGDVPMAENFKIYRTYGVLREQQKSDILVGYHMQEFVVAGGEICAALTTEKPEIDNIRVLLMTTGFKSLFHSEIILSCEETAVLEYGKETDRKQLEVAAGETVAIKSDDSRLSEGRIVFRPKDGDALILVGNIERAQGTPSYPGHMEITKESGGLVLLNEVDLEEYLKRVVPSEMPATYELEALKAQAICARTYAWKQIQNNGYSQYGAHVDDSTNYQVYNNTNTFEATNAAVNETFGQLLAYEGVPIEAFYYSTSSGHGTDGSVWGGDASATPYLRAVSINSKGKMLDLKSNDAFSEFIKNMDVDAYDSSFAMFRWNAKTTSKILAGKITDIGRITGVTVTERGPGGIAKALKVVGTSGTKTIQGQSKIRNILGSASLVFTKKDGDTMSGIETLPSGFIYIENDGTDEDQVTTFTIYGGGYGHGVGMSQNGAQGMAKEGMSSGEILAFFYQGCEIMDIGEVV